MRQRAMIAMALWCEPEFLVADEPTTALDVTIQAQILALLNELQQRMGVGLRLITHDLGVVRRAHRVLVMYAGRVAEAGDVHAVMRAPRHPYTGRPDRRAPWRRRDGCEHPPRAGRDRGQRAGPRRRRRCLPLRHCVVITSHEVGTPVVWLTSVPVASRSVGRVSHFDALKQWWRDEQSIGSWSTLGHSVASTVSSHR
jgi:ABC-type glutathione transport system ATPase component